jgi:hypothetical protein
MAAPNRQTILLITHSRDVFTIDRVIDGLRERGARPLRLDTDLFPGELRLGLEDGGDGPRYFVGDVAGREIGAVWTRSFWPPKVARELEPEYRQSCAHQSQVVLDGLYDGLADAHWMNRPEAIATGRNKLRQHRLAVASGLAVPPTLITNDPERVRRFYDACGGEVVAKVLAPLSMSMDRSGPFVPTSELRRSDLDELDELRYAPMIFQRRVAKARELRVAFVAGRCFAGAIDASRSAAGGTDWRLAEGDEIVWRPGELPDATARHLSELMVRLGLGYGAIDFIVTPEGEHVFLEVNPLGEWGMLERDLDLPISRAVVEALLAGCAQPPRARTS